MERGTTMNQIGEKIKELRRKNDMTQEKLADHLRVAYQTVSKWETGVTSPDLSLIVPIARLFRITTDELFSYNENADHIREQELEDQFRETWESGDLQKRFEVSEQAVREFPGEMKWHDRLAWAQAMRSFGYKDDVKCAEEQEEAIRRFAAVIENTPEGKLRASSIQGIVQYLTFRGRFDEAKEYANLYPEKYSVSKDDVLLSCLQGTERIIHCQRMLDNAMLDLLNLIGNGSDSACDAQEQILNTLIPDKNYLYYHCFLADIYLNRARFRVKDKKYDSAIQMLSQALYHAGEYDKFTNGEMIYNYTSPFFDRVEYNIHDTCKTGMTSRVDDLLDELKGTQFDPLRNREDFERLLEQAL